MFYLIVPLDVYLPDQSTISSLMSGYMICWSSEFQEKVPMSVFIAHLGDRKMGAVYRTPKKLVVNLTETITILCIFDLCWIDTVWVVLDNIQNGLLLLIMGDELVPLGGTERCLWYRLLCQIWPLIQDTISHSLHFYWI